MARSWNGFDNVRRRTRRRRPHRTLLQRALLSDDGSSSDTGRRPLRVYDTWSRSRGPSIPSLARSVSFDHIRGSRDTLNDFTTVPWPSPHRLVSSSSSSSSSAMSMGTFSRLIDRLTDTRQLTPIVVQPLPVVLIPQQFVGLHVEPIGDVRMAGFYGSRPRRPWWYCFVCRRS